MNEPGMARVMHSKIKGSLEHGVHDVKVKAISCGGVCIFQTMCKPQWMES